MSRMCRLILPDVKLIYWGVYEVNNKGKLILRYIALCSKVHSPSLKQADTMKDN